MSTDHYTTLKHRYITSTELERTPAVAAVSDYTGQGDRPAGGPFVISALVVRDKLTECRSEYGAGDWREGSAEGGAGYYLEPVAQSGVDTKWYSEAITGSDTNVCPESAASGVGTTSCPGWASFGICGKCHQFSKQLFCGKEWCENCGSYWSKVHQRRFGRWLPKARQVAEMGYLVITFPLDARGRLRKKKDLSRVRSLVNHYFKRKWAPRGLTRWHWFGEGGGVYHPHVNILLDGGRFRKSELKEIRRYLARLMEVPDLVINYQYTSDVKKMVHWLMYVTRATFLDVEWDRGMARELRGFRNQSSFGSWKGKPVWDLKGEDMKFEHIADLEKSICPICGERIKWDRRPRPIKELCDLVQEGKAKDIGGGYYYIDVKDGLLKKKGPSQ